MSRVVCDHMHHMHALQAMFADAAGAGDVDNVGHDHDHICGGWFVVRLIKRPTQLAATHNSIRQNKSNENRRTFHP